MSFALRDYQEQAANAIEHKWLTHSSTVAIKPTGTGKTVLFAEIIRRRLPGRALVVAHREELILQAKDKIERFVGIDCEIEMGEQRASESLFHKMPVVVATVQTLTSGRNGKRRMHKFDPKEFSTVVIDEFHHATAASYRLVLDYFQLGNPDLKVLGVTATPDRTDEMALGQVCESVAFDYEIVDAINDGWLVPVEQQMVTIAGLDFSSVRTTAGDLNGADLAAVMESEKAMQGLCAATLEIIGSRQTIVFTASVKQAEQACAIFNRHKAGIADWVCGETEKEARRKTMANVLEGRTQILCNVGIATEGFDAPGIEVIIMGRPTKSRALYAQMAGRGTRPFPGVVDAHSTPDTRRAAIAASPKPACLLVDFVGNSGRHKLITGTDILGGKFSDDVKELALETMRKEGRNMRLDEALQGAEDEIRRKEAEERERKRKLEEARKARLVAKVRFSAHAVSPFDVFDIQPEQRTERGTRTLTEKQRSILLKQGIDPDSLPFAQAKQILDEQFRRWDGNLCSFKQAKLLMKYGYETKEMTRAEASSLIDALAKNNWRRADPAPTEGGEKWL